MLTKAKPFGSMLLRHAPGPATDSQPTTLAFDSYINTDPLRSKLNLQQKIAALQVKASSKLQSRGAQYKLKYDAKICVKL